MSEAADAEEEIREEIIEEREERLFFMREKRLGGAWRWVVGRLGWRCLWYIWEAESGVEGDSSSWKWLDVDGGDVPAVVAVMGGELITG